MHNISFVYHTDSANNKTNVVHQKSIYPWHVRYKAQNDTTGRIRDADDWKQKSRIPFRHF